MVNFLSDFGFKGRSSDLSGLFGVMRYSGVDMDSEAKVSGSAEKRFGPAAG